MCPENFCFYEDDEGIAVDLVLTVFGLEEIQCINVESESVDEKMKNDINYLIDHQYEFLHKINMDVSEYITKVYNENLQEFKLIKLYVFPDKENEFGFMFSTGIDREHGIGVKFKNDEIIRIGGGEVSFI